MPLSQLRPGRRVPPPPDSLHSNSSSLPLPHLRSNNGKLYQLLLMDTPR